MGFAEARRVAQEQPPRGMCAAWVWDSTNHSGPVAPQQQGGGGSARGSDSGGGGGSRTGNEWMVVDVPSSRPVAASGSAGSQQAVAGFAVPQQPNAGDGTSEVSSAPPQRQQRRRLPRLLVADSEGWVQSCSPDGFEGAAAYVVSLVQPCKPPKIAVTGCLSAICSF